MDFVLVGGIAAVIHGAARVTYDVDLVYGRSPENCERLVSALRPFHPYLRDTPPGLPFAWEPRTLLHGLNFTLTTGAGDIDLLGEIIAGGTYEELLPHTSEFEALAELEALRDEAQS